MNHLLKYNTIIENAKKINRVKHRGLYYEEHHIKPKCLSGKDDEDNLVLLTAKEHFVCHKLLTHIYPKHRGISYAYIMMTSIPKIMKVDRNYIITSRDYAYSKELYKNLTEETKEKMKKPRSKESIEKGRLAHIGLKYIRKNKNNKPHSVETCLKISLANTGKTRSEESKEKNRKSHLGKKSPKGKTRSDKGSIRGPYKKRI